MSEPNQSLEEFLFEAALEKSSAAERAAFLDGVCRDNPALRARLDALLEGHFQAEGFLNAGQKKVEKVSRPPSAGDEAACTFIGRYKLLERIGEGGFGEVWMAEQKEPVKRCVALKIIKLGMDTKQVVARFEAERQALALMDHPNIARVFDGGATDTGRPYFVMELVRGVRITDYCERNQLPTRDRLKLFIQVCLAIQHAHQKGIIHRDIKPSNILVTLNDGVPVPKVIDFGIAKATQMELTEKTVFTQFHQFLGTPAYVSPEQAAMTGLDIDTRSDIYSLGVLLYELLTGATPFDTQELLKAGLDGMRQIIRERVPLLPSTRINRILPSPPTADSAQSKIKNQKSKIADDLDWIVMKCLEKDRARRYETANGLSLDVGRHLNHEPILARPPSRLYEFHKAVRRNWLGFAATAAVTASLFVGLGVSIWMLDREREAKREQARLRLQAETEASKSQQVARFLQDVLESVNPDLAQGRDTKVLRSVLDKTAERIGNDLSRQPEVEAQLRATLGHVYGALSEYPKAEEMYRRAVDLVRKARGSEDRGLAKYLNSLADTLQRDGKLPDAKAAVSEAIAIQRSLPDKDARLDLARSLNTLAGVESARSRVATEAALREALSIQREWLDKDDPEVLETLNSLASALWRQHKLTEAEEIAREVLVNRRKLLGAADPGVASALNQIGLILTDQGNFEQADAVLREALDIRQKIYPKEHANIAQSLSNLARLSRRENKLSDAEGFLDQALEINRKIFPDGSAELAQQLNDLGILLFGQGKMSSAEQVDREALAMRKRLFPGANSVAYSLANLGQVLEVEGKVEEARTLYLQEVDGKSVVATVAQYRLALISSDPQEAANWLRKAAELGDPICQSMLAERYATGLGVPIDPGESLKWYRKAADQGDANAQAKVGWSFEHGGVVRQDLAEAAKWYAASAGQGNTLAQMSVAAMYKDGRGVPKDPQQAANWYRKASAQGTPHASSALAGLYDRGEGVERDPAEGAKWHAKAAEQYAQILEQRMAIAGNTQAQNDVAWFFATCSEAAVRDGPLSAALAKSAVDKTERKDPTMLDTLAAAYAEQGSFTNAVVVEQEALRLLQNESSKADLRSRLILYQAGSAYRSETNEFPDLTPEPGDALQLSVLLRVRGSLWAQRGEIKSAIGYVAQANKLNPADDLCACVLAPLVLESGDVDGYRKDRHEILQRFGSTKDPHTAQRVAEASMLLPLEGPDLELASHNADTGLNVGTNVSVAVFRFTKGLALYRQGRFAESLDWLKPALAADVALNQVAKSYAVLAMAGHQLGRGSEAGAALAKATEIVETKLPPSGSSSPGADFPDWFIARILLREAKSLMDGSITSQAPRDAHQD